MKFLFYQNIVYPILVLGFLCTGFSPAFADGNFCDYLPKYRKYKSHYQIDKILYTEKRTIVYFRFIVQKDGAHILYGNDHPSSWYLRTPRRMRGVEIQFKQLELRDIQINNQVKRPSLSKVPDISYELNRGDVVTYQVHFVRIPNYIRMLDMIEGKYGDTDPDKLNCFDIMIKTLNHPLLGTETNEQQVVSKFEDDFTYIKPKVAQNPQSRVQPAFNPEKSSDRATNKEDNLSSDSPATLTYMPTALTNVDDMKCDQRVIMPNVQFKDNDVAFAGRIKAIQNIRIVAEYMRQFPKATVNLFGHTDVHGSAYKNLNLSRERAFSVKRELVKMGIDSDRIKVYFYGGKQPLPRYKDGGPANRRVEVQPLCAN